MDEFTGVTQLDIENATEHGISRKKGQYLRIKAEKKIKNILVLDRYVNYIRKLNLTYDLSTLDKKSNAYLDKLLGKYPFDSDLISISKEELIALASKRRFKTFHLYNGLQDDISLKTVLNVSDNVLQTLLDIKNSLFEL